jgi:hypothetical protein
MFKSLAELGAGRRHVVPEAAPSHCSDNRPDRRPAAAFRQARPHRLTCRWEPAAAGGRLECHWQIEPQDLPMSVDASAEAPGPSCTTGKVQGLQGFALCGQPAIHVAMP